MKGIEAGSGMEKARGTGKRRDRAGGEGEPKMKGI